MKQTVDLLQGLFDQQESKSVFKHPTHQESFFLWSEGRRNILESRKAAADAAKAFSIPKTNQIILGTSIQARTHLKPNQQWQANL